MAQRASFTHAVQQSATESVLNPRMVWLCVRQQFDVGVLHVLGIRSGLGLGLGYWSAL